MNEIIERACVAVDEAMGGHDEFDDDDHRRIAQAVIRAMRVPTDAMVEAGEREIFEHMAKEADWTLKATRDGWQAMIDAALAEP